MYVFMLGGGWPLGGLWTNEILATALNILTMYYCEFRSYKNLEDIFKTIPNKQDKQEQTLNRNL